MPHDAIKWPKGRKFITVKEAAALLENLLEHRNPADSLARMTDNDLIAVFSMTVKNKAKPDGSDWQEIAGATMICLADDFNVPHERLKTIIWPIIQERAAAEVALRWVGGNERVENG